MSTASTIYNSDIKLTFRGRLNYSLQSFGYNFLYYWMSAFTALFCTDMLGISAGVVSALLLGVRVFDVVNDPLIGSLADRSPFDKKGNRYTRWCGIGGICLAILIILFFSAQSSWSYAAKVAWVCVIYVLITIASTANDMPYGALNGTITSNSYERVKASGLRMLLGSLGMNITGMIAVPLVIFFSGTGKMEAGGFSRAVMIAGAVCIFCCVWTWRTTNEAVHPISSKIPFKAQIKSFAHNKYIILAALSFFVVGFNGYAKMTMLVYYFTYYVGNAGMFSLYSTLAMISGFLGTGFLVPFVYKLTHHKGRSIMLLTSVYTVCYFLLYFVQSGSIPFWILIFFGNAATTAQTASTYGLIGDTADYGEYITGYRCDGFQYSFCSLMMKFGGAIGPAALLALLGYYGYVARAAQNEAVLQIMRVSISFLPAVVGVLGFILFCFYNLTEEKHKEISLELQKRHAAAQQTTA
jgi:sugar (glycoside-pentoside-hexuronide) transporter